MTGAMALLLLACIVFTSVVCLFAPAASAYADFDTWSNRSTRVLEPADYNTNGTCSCDICCWKGVQGIGNLGIGDGNYTLMKPDVMNGMTDAAKANMMAGGMSEPAEKITGNGTFVPQISNVKNETAVQEGKTPVIEAPAPADAAPRTESLLPSYVMAGDVITEGTPDTISLGQPFPNIMNEDPTEASVLYGKLVGLPMPDGSRMDFGIKCLGYEY